MDKIGKQMDEIDKQMNEYVFPNPLVSSLGFILNKIAVQMQGRFDKSLAPLGIRSPHYGVLTLLMHEGPQSQVSLGKKLCIDRTTMVAIVDDLERQKLVERHVVPRDRRMHSVTLTAKGQEVLAQSNKYAEILEKEFLAPLPSQEQEQFRKILMELIKVI